MSSSHNHTKATNQLYCMQKSSEEYGLMIEEFLLWSKCTQIVERHGTNPVLFLVQV